MKRTIALTLLISLAGIVSACSPAATATPEPATLTPTVLATPSASPAASPTVAPSPS